MIHGAEISGREGGVIQDICYFCSREGGRPLDGCVVEGRWWWADPAGSYEEKREPAGLNTHKYATNTVKYTAQIQ